MKVYPRRVF